MAQTKNKTEARLQELISHARQMNVEVRTEKLFREIGYRARSGRCRIKDRKMILIDRDAPISEQVDFLSATLAELQSNQPPLAPSADDVAER